MTTFDRATALQAPDGRWVEVASGSCDDSGAFATGFMAFAWGRVDPTATVNVVFRGVPCPVQTNDQGWWMFVAPSRSGDVPEVAGGVRGGVRLACGRGAPVR